MTLEDHEVRHLAISLLTAKTDRDRQVRIGASDLSDGCDFCLGAKLLGQTRESGLSERTWLGRTLGTATHLVMENRVERAAISEFAALEGAETEKHVYFAELEGYGKIGGSIDLLLPGHIIDWKGSTKKKSALMQDYLQTAQGLEPRYGRTHKDVKLSEKQYAEEMEKQVHKVTGYYGQQTLYMHSPEARAHHASLVFFNRDGTGYFDVPHANRYDDPTAMHDVWVLSFEYNEEYALALIARGQNIYNRLTQGGSLTDLAKSPHCFVCSNEPADLEQTVAPPSSEVVKAEFDAIVTNI